MNITFKEVSDNFSEYLPPREDGKKSKLRFGWAIRAVFIYAIWSLRQRGGQVIPVACAFVLLICSTQTIGTLHDIASTQTRQQIAQSWRGPYDLLVRPSSAIRSLERSENWIDPQSALENYGGISQQQVTALRSLPRVIGVTPFATVGWQNMTIQIPIVLPSQGMYRISANWGGQALPGSDASVLVDVTDLIHLTLATPMDNAAISYLVSPSARTPVTFNLSLPAIQELIGIPTPDVSGREVSGRGVSGRPQGSSLHEQASLLRLLLAGTPAVPAFHLTIHVDKLLGQEVAFPLCQHNAACWQPLAVQQGASTYQSNGVQVLRFSQPRYTNHLSSAGDGQVSVQMLGKDMQGPLYRLPLDIHVAIPGNVTLPDSPLLKETPLLPLIAPERLPWLPGAVRFIPLTQACAINGPNCYTGVYIRLSGVEEYSSSSLAVLQATAAAIAQRTGLHVDILDGSSLRPITLSTDDYQADRKGRPYMTATPQSFQTAWRAVGVAVQIVHGLDTMQEILLILCAIVCLLAIGIAGILVGIGRRGDVILLQQMGWNYPLLVCSVYVHAFFLCLPGCLLAAFFILLGSHFIQSNLPVAILWGCIGLGMLCYCICLVVMATTKLEKRTGQSFWSTQVVYGKMIAPLANASAIAIATFLIAEEYLLVTRFNRVLMLTVLGKQVQEVLESSQIALLISILLAALLTVALCTILRLWGRRDEITLLAMLGWERRTIVRRLMWSNWLPALISGEIGVLLAFILLSLGGAYPGGESIVGLLSGGPVLGIVLASIAAIGPIMYETKRVYL